MYQMKKGGSKNPKQQAAIAMSMKATGKKPKMKKGGFPDLTGDGKVTKADILKGRGVFQKGGISANKPIPNAKPNSKSLDKPIPTSKPTGKSDKMYFKDGGSMSSKKKMQMGGSMKPIKTGYDYYKSTGPNLKPGETGYISKKPGYSKNDLDAISKGKPTSGMKGATWFNNIKSKKK